MKKEALIIFAKNPVLGNVKTRIAKDAGDVRALEIYNELLNITYANTVKLSLDKFLFLSDFNDNNIFDKDYKQQIQKGNDLGEKMRNALEEIFSSGYEKICIIGTDCPGLSFEIVTQAFEVLDKCDFIIGPTKDGGYYLLGMKKQSDFVFEEIRWSTDKVLEETLKKINIHSQKYLLLKELRDIDTLYDYLAQ